MIRYAVGFLAWMGALAQAASAQLIQIKTIPLAQVDPFVVFPSHNLGMGDLSIALADTLSDLTRNPALGARLGGPHFVSTPLISSLSFNAGGERALPVGVAGKSRGWFGGFSVAAQVVDPSGGSQVFVPATSFPQNFAPIPTQRPQSHNNAFAFGALGKSWSDAGLSVGGSVFWARLTGVDGVDLLYAGSQSLKQLGHAADFRLGVLKEWAGARTLEAVVLYDRFHMIHDVTFLDFSWNPATQTTVTKQRLETNRDYTDTWGLHLAYQRPLGEPGWRIGWIATANRMFHPEIPNYQVQTAGIRNIPWDPGDSWAYNLGLGVGRAVGPARFGMEAVYEPIWSHTWGEADAPLASRLGDTIPAGGMTVENRFRFSNVLFRIGASHELALSGPDAAAGLQLGLAVRSISYHLAQFDHVQVAGREDDEQWVEWTPTWGLTLRFPELALRYQGRVTNGVGRPGTFFRGGGDVALAASPTAGSILATPSGPLNMSDVKVATHQVSISVPFKTPRPAGGSR